MEFNSGMLFTRAHLLEHLREKEDAQTITQMSNDLKICSYKIQKFLRRLMVQGFVSEKYMPIKNHFANHYELTDYAKSYLMKHELRSFLDRRNPQLRGTDKLLKKFSETQRLKVGKNVYIIPRKELVGVF